MGGGGVFMVPTPPTEFVDKSRGIPNYVGYGGSSLKRAGGGVPYGEGRRPNGEGHSPENGGQGPKFNLSGSRPGGRATPSSQRLSMPPPLSNIQPCRGLRVPGPTLVLRAPGALIVERLLDGVDGWLRLGPWEVEPTPLFLFRLHPCKGEGGDLCGFQARPYQPC